MDTIGKVARHGGVSTNTLRYYEKEGLIAPEAKTAAGYRLYSEEAARRIQFIKQAQNSGFSLSEIKELLTMKTSEHACCDDVRGLAIRKKLLIETKIRRLQDMSRALDRLVSDCDGGIAPTDRCAILEALETSTQEMSI